MKPKSSPFLALQHRNFRLIWTGQLISLSGSMMQSAAILWHVSLLVPDDQKGLALGAVGLVRVVPIVIFSLVSGVVADALDRRKLMLITQSGMTLTAVALAFITFRGLDALWLIYLLTALSAAFTAFDNPARQSLVPNLVPRAHLPNAISLMTIMFQTASVLGPTLAGIAIASLGVGWVYALNAVSFLAVISALLLMRGVPERAQSEKSEISLRAALEGLRFVFSAPLIRSTMLLDFFANFFSSAMALLPIFAQDILPQDGLLLSLMQALQRALLPILPRFTFDIQAVSYGLLYAAPSVGAVLASVLMVRLVERIDRRGRTLLWAVVGYGLATVIFGFSRSFWLTFLCLALTGATDTVSMVLRNIIRQLTTPDALRGRMTSVNMVFFMGGPNLGELEAGLVANWLGAPFSVVSGGVACLLVTAWVAWQTPALRRYRRDEPMLAPSGAAAD
jgi:MFS family permease